MIGPIHEIRDWRFGDRPDLDIIRQECQLANGRGQRVSLDPAQLIELLDMLSYVEEPEAVSPNEHHSLDDCERCDEMEEEIEDLKDENTAYGKEINELERNIGVLQDEIDAKNEAIDKLIKTPCHKCGT